MKGDPGMMGLAGLKGHPVSMIEIPRVASKYDDIKAVQYCSAFVKTAVWSAVNVGQR